MKVLYKEGEYSDLAHILLHYIENYWAQLKKLIIRIYCIIPKKIYTLFIKEIEFRINLSYKTLEEKNVSLKNVFKNIYEINNYDYKYFMAL